MRVLIGILIAVVVLVGLVAAADLLLSFAVIRRLAALQSRMQVRGSAEGSPAIGHRVGDFRVELLSGGGFTLADLVGTRAIVVFLMHGCEPCKNTIADLRTLPVPLSWPLYILVAGDGDVLAVRRDVPTGAHVGAVQATDAVIEAFGVDGFPTALTIDDGVISATSLDVSGLLESAGR